MRFFFVTSNKGKFIAANKIFKNHDLELIQKKLDIQEKRSNTIEDISVDKAKQAFEILKEPVIVEDSGFIINSLGNFPGPYVNFILDSIGIKGILNLVGNDRRCFFRSVVTFYDGVKIKTFHLDEKGHISEQPSTNKHKESWSDLWKIYIPEGWNKTLNDMSKAEYESCEKRYQEESPFKKLAEYLKN